MDRMPEPLTSFRQFVEADLRRAARLISKVQDEIDPQFRIATAEGDYAIAVTLPADTYERKRVFRRVSNFMALKQGASFILASELQVPDCVYALGVSHKEVIACMAMIGRHPKPWTKHNFGNVQWLDRAQVGPEFLDILPKGERTLSQRDIDETEAWFGPAGKFPAVHLPTGELRGV